MQHRPCNWNTWLRPLVWPFALCIGLLASSQPCLALDLSGCWEGCWRSDTNGHDGVLRATIQKQDGNHYCAHFSGTFYKIIPFRYSVLLNVPEKGETLKLEGSSYLGRLFGGTFTYSGTATYTDFQADYSSSKDCGEFRMKRV